MKALALTAKNVMGLRAVSVELAASAAGKSGSPKWPSIDNRIAGPGSPDDFPPVIGRRMALKPGPAPAIPENNCGAANVLAPPNAGRATGRTRISPARRRA